MLKSLKVTTFVVSKLFGAEQQRGWGGWAIKLLTIKRNFEESIILKYIFLLLFCFLWQR